MKLFALLPVELSRIRTVHGLSLTTLGNGNVRDKKNNDDSLVP